MKRLYWEDVILVLVVLAVLAAGVGWLLHAKPVESSLPEAYETLGMGAVGPTGVAFSIAPPPADWRNWRITLPLDTVNGYCLWSCPPDRRCEWLCTPDAEEPEP